MKKNRLIKLETPIRKKSSGSIPALSTENTAKLASNGAFSVLYEKTVPKSVPSKKSYRKRFLSNSKSYKLPTIVRPAKGDWFVKFFYERPDSPGKYKEFRVRDGVNYFTDLKEREEAIQELKKDITFDLEKKAFNPFKHPHEGQRKIKKTLAEIKEKHRLMMLTEAIDWIKETKEGKNKSDKYLTEYTWLANHFVPWCKEKNLIFINDPTIDHIELFLSEKLEKEKWSARTYNNKISILTTFFNYLTSKRKMPVNPIQPGMLERIDNKAEKNKYYDRHLLETLLPKIQEKSALRRFIQWTYYTCARGTELRALKIKDVDLELNKIVIMAETGKTGVHVGKRNIPMCVELKTLIEAEKLTSYPKDWFVFGSNGMPGPDKVYHGYFSDIYFQVKKDLEIDFRYSIYSFKHTRVVDLLVAGFDPVKVMYLTGHTNWGSFQAYIRELGAVMDKEMIGNTLSLNL